MLRYLWLRGGGARVGASSHPADGSRTPDLLVRVAELMLNLGCGQSLVPAPNIVCKYLHRGSNLIPALASKASRVVPDVAILLVQPLGQELPGSQYMHAYTGGGLLGVGKHNSRFRPPLLCDGSSKSTLTSAARAIGLRAAGQIGMYSRYRVDIYRLPAILPYHRSHVPARPHSHSQVPQQ